MNRTLLIVDDLRSNREILKNILSGEYDIIEAAHGQEAMALLTRDFDLLSAVLLDLRMPVMDGFEVLEAMRRSERLSQLPVIVMTGQTDADTEERALRLGAKDYISKPYKTAIVRQRIQNTIHLRETAATVNALRRDSLTGLYSREAFFEKAAEMVADRPERFYTMACFDVDGFKVVNDQYGTRKGDDTLRHIADVFDKAFTPEGGIVSRMTADNFAVLYPTAFADSPRLAQTRADAGTVAGLASPISFSIGRYVVDDKTLTPSAMYDRAALAAASVKGLYGVEFAYYSEQMRDRLIREQELVTQMASALEGGQFEVWFQPQMNHVTKALIGAEALVRWRHPQKGLISPAEFIPLFEKNGFIYQLDKFVWTECCKCLRGWLDAGRAPLPLSVNVSRYDMFRADVIDVITGLTKAYRLPNDLLRLEITESAFAESTEQIVRVVSQFIKRGFTVEIDDFGSGYSSLNTLKDVSAQIVKLDMRFLERTGNSRRSGNIVESVVRMTKWLGMSVIAEGVETAAQADFLCSIGCSYIQGYLYARPMTRADYERYCEGIGKEERLLTLETVEDLDNNAFWDPDSMDTLIFNSYVGGACIFEQQNGRIELLRATDKYVGVLGSTSMTVEDVLRLDWTSHIEPDSAARLLRDIEASIADKSEVTGDYTFIDLPGCGHKTYLRSTLRAIATAGDRCLVYCTNQNITRQRAAEEESRLVAEQLQSVMDHVDVGIIASAERDGVERILFSNNRYYEIIGYTREQFAREISDPYATVVPGDRAMVAEKTRALRAQGGSVQLEYAVLRRDGRETALRAMMTMGRFAGAETPVQLTVVRDISRLRQSQEDVRSAYEQLSAIMRDMPGGFARMRVDADGEIRPVYVNEGLLRMIGLSGQNGGRVADMYGRDACAGVHPDDRAIAQSALSHMRADGESRAFRYRVLRADNTYIWVSVHGRRSIDAQGETYLNVYYTDITNELSKEQERNLLLDNLPCGAALLRYDGQTLTGVYLNRRYWELVERAPEPDGAITMAALHPDDRVMILRELDAAITQNRTMTCRVRILSGTGAYLPFRASARVVPVGGGQFSVYVAYTRAEHDSKGGSP